MAEADQGLRGVGEVRMVGHADALGCAAQRPCLGVTIDEALIAERTARQIFFNLFAEGWHRREQ